MSTIINKAKMKSVFDRTVNDLVTKCSEVINYQLESRVRQISLLTRGMSEEITFILEPLTRRLEANDIPEDIINAVSTRLEKIYKAEGWDLDLDKIVPTDNVSRWVTHLK